MTLKEDLRNSLTGKIDELSISIVMVELSLLLDKSENRKEHYPGDGNIKLLQAFLSSKRLEGCSEKTLNYYQSTIGMMISELEISLTEMSTDDIRNYLSDYQSRRGSSKVTIDNIRRIFSSFFSCLNLRIV